MREQKIFQFGIVVFILFSFCFFTPKTYAVSPEFDGGYLEKTNNQLVEMRVSTCNVNWQNRAYITDLNKVITIDSDKLKGIIVQGRYPFEVASLHPIEKGKIGTIDSTISAWLLKNPIDLRSKGIGDNAYYFKPRDELLPGKYAFWIGKNAWVFEVQNKQLTDNINKVFVSFVENIIAGKDGENVMLFSEEKRLKFKDEKYFKKFLHDSKEIRDACSGVNIIKTSVNKNAAEVYYEWKLKNGKNSPEIHLPLVKENNEWFLDFQL